MRFKRVPERRLKDRKFATATGYFQQGDMDGAVNLVRAMEAKGIDPDTLHQFLNLVISRLRSKVKLQS